MALGTIESLVKKRVPFLPDTAETNDKIASELTEAFYLFQTCLGKDDADEASIEDESNYTNTQKIFIAAYVSFMVLRNDISSKSGAEGGDKIKRAKADVTEVEFQTAKESGQKTVAQVLDDLKLEACTMGRKIGCCPAICNMVEEYSGDVPLLYVRTIE